MNVFRNLECLAAAHRNLQYFIMTARYERPVSLAALLARKIAVFALALFAVAALSHRFASLTVGHFLAVSAVAAALAALALLLAVVGLARLWAVGAKGGWSSLAALVCALLVIAPIGYGAWLYVELPATADVSSDPGDPPRWLTPPPGEVSRLGGAATDRQRGRLPESDAELAGRRYEGAIDRVLQAVRIAMAGADMKIVSETGAGGAATPSGGPPAGKEKGADGSGGLPSIVPVPLGRPSPLVLDAPAAPKVVRIQAVHRTPIFGLTSDVLIRLREEGDSTVADMRVASRFGPHDLGTGAALIRRFFGSLDRDLLGIAGGRNGAPAGG